MRSTSPVPGAIEQPLEDHMNKHMAPSESRVPPIYRETTVCYAYMCVYAYGCSEKTNRPSQVMMRRCMRYLPEELRIKTGLSDFALDLLAKRRDSGKRLTTETTAILDDVRPDGPIRKVKLK